MDGPSREGDGSEEATRRPITLSREISLFIDRVVPSYG